MTNKTAKWIRLIYGCVLSVSLVIAGLCLMAVCVEIYRSGDQPFSSQAVALGFSQIALPVYLSIALILGGFILHWVLPVESAKKAADKQYPMMLKRMKDRYDLSKAEPELQAAIRDEENFRKRCWLIFAVVFAIGSVIFLVYGLNPANFHQTQINGSMISAMYVLLPCMAVPFALAVFSSYFSRRSMKKELELVKKAIQVCPKNEIAKSKSSSLMIPRLALLGVGLAFLIYGFFAGGTMDVLTKAINICTECVGLG